MPMIDLNLRFSAQQAVTSTGDTASTNVHDSGSANSADHGLVDDLWLSVMTQTTATSGGSATVQAVLQDSADNSTFADVIAGAAIAVASVTAGTALLQTKLPAGTRRYIRVVYRVGTAALTAGKFDAYITLGLQRNVARPSGFTVS